MEIFYRVFFNSQHFCVPHIFCSRSQHSCSLINVGQAITMLAGRTKMLAARGKMLTVRAKYWRREQNCNLINICTYNIEMICLPFYSFKSSLLVDLVNLDIIFKLIGSDYYQLINLEVYSFIMKLQRLLAYIVIYLNSQCTYVYLNLFIILYIYQYINISIFIVMNWL